MAPFIKQFVLLALAISVANAMEPASLTHSAILDKFHPTVKEFSQSLALSIGESDQFPSKIYDVITNTLAAQIDDLVVQTNGPLAATWGLCCQCNSCYRSCSGCGRRCCCHGGNGCTCRSCSAPTANMTLSAVTEGSTPHQIWASSTKEILVKRLRSLVPVNSDRMCCNCVICSASIYYPGFKSMCCTTGAVCVCKHVAMTDTIQMDSMDNMVTLSAEAETAVRGVEDLVDQITNVIQFF